jgi:curved DNA-binding protein CbpA
MNAPNSLDPFQVLGLPTDATEAEIRARYLALVKQFPPERDPDKFHEFHTAFQAAKDPLLIARRLIIAPSDEPPEWSEALEQQKRNPPALTPRLLLSLGNRDDSTLSGKARSEVSEPDRDQSIIGDPDQKQYFVEQPHE